MSSTESTSRLGLDRLSRKQRDRLRSLGLYSLVGVALFVIVFPLYWTLNSSLMSADVMYTFPQPMFPFSPTLENYTGLFQDTRFPSYYVNSIVITTGVILITTTLATLGGYGLTRIDIPFKKTFARGILFGYMFPPILLAIPMFILWRQLGLINSYLGVILGISAISLPFSLWLMWQFFQTVPESLEESAQMAGAERFRAFYEIALPLSKPGVIAVATFSYAVGWNEYTIPKVLLPEYSRWPLTLGIEAFVVQGQTLWPFIMAAIFLTIVPAFLFVYALQKYLLRGFRTGGIK